MTPEQHVLLLFLNRWKDLPYLTRTAIYFPAWKQADEEERD